MISNNTNDFLLQAVYVSLAFLKFQKTPWAKSGSKLQRQWTTNVIAWSVVGWDYKTVTFWVNKLKFNTSTPRFTFFMELPPRKRYFMTVTKDVAFELTIEGEVTTLHMLIHVDKRRPFRCCHSATNGLGRFYSAWWQIAVCMFKSLSHPTPFNPSSFHSKILNIACRSVAEKRNTMKHQTLCLFIPEITLWMIAGPLNWMELNL